MNTLTVLKPRERSIPTIEPIIRSRRTAPLRLVESPSPKPRQTTPRRASPTFHVLPNDIVAPSPFGIYSRRDALGYHVKPLVIEYGKVQMTLSGQKLNVKDGDVFIALTQLAVERGELIMPTNLNELCRHLGTSYVSTIKESITKSLKRLFDAKVNSVTEGKKWVLHRIVDWVAGDDLNGDFVLQLDPWFNQLYGEKLLTTINPQFRLSLKGDIAKQLYMFFQRQVSARKKAETINYPPIRLERLCDLIGYDRDGKVPLYEKRFRIKAGLEELKNRKYLRSYSMKNDLISVTIKAQKQKEEQKALPEPENKATEAEQREPQQGMHLLKQIEDAVGMRVTGNRAHADIHAMKIVAVGNAIRKPRLLNEFADWLKEQRGWLKSISYGTLDPHKEVFETRFMADMGYKMPSREAIDREFKLVTESDVERRNRLEQERKAAQVEEERRKEDAANLQWAEDCIKANFADLREGDLSVLGNRIPEMLHLIETQHGENWKGTFERFVKGVEQEHQRFDKTDPLHSRSGGYLFLFKTGGKSWKVSVETAT